MLEESQSLYRNEIKEKSRKAPKPQKTKQMVTEISMDHSLRRDASPHSPMLYPGLDTKPLRQTEKTYANPNGTLHGADLKYEIDRQIQLAKMGTPGVEVGEPTLETAALLGHLGKSGQKVTKQSFGKQYGSSNDVTFVGRQNIRRKEMTA